MPKTDLTPLTQERALATIRIVAEAMTQGEPAITYGDLARRLGMSRVNGQGLNRYLTEAAAICAEQGPAQCRGHGRVEGEPGGGAPRCRRKARSRTGSMPRPG